MGFHNGAYATVWGVETNDRGTQVQISISDKDRNGEYQTSWRGYVTMAGGKCTAQNMAKNLKKGDRIKLVSIDQRNRYDAEKKREYYYNTVFEFENVQSGNGGSGNSSSKPASSAPAAPAASSYTDEEDPF